MAVSFRLEFFEFFVLNDRPNSFEFLSEFLSILWIADFCLPILKIKLSPLLRTDEKQISWTWGRLEIIYSLPSTVTLETNKKKISSINYSRMINCFVLKWLKKSSSVIVYFSDLWCGFSSWFVKRKQITIKLIEQVQFLKLI